eukprot:PITA_18483
MSKVIEQQRQYRGSISEARGASRGVATIWNQGIWNCISETINKHWIKTTLENKVDQQAIIIYNIYVPNHRRDKESCWHDLKYNLDTKENTNIILGGDFNLILHANEKRGAVAGVVYNYWIQHVEGFPGFIWETKLRKTKQAIKEWAKTKYQEPEKVKKGIKNNMESIQREIEENDLSQENKQQENELYLHLYQVNREEKSKWRLKSRQLWLQGGEKNSAFFHKKTIARKIRNNVSSILDVEGDRQSTQEAIRRAAIDHYGDLLTETKEAEDYTDLLQHLPIGISKEMNDSLRKEIDEEEIRRSIWTLHPNKAPGLDGFPICFYR